MARRGREWSTVAVEMFVMFVVNYGVVGVLLLLERVFDVIDQRGPIGTRLFFVFLFTVITVLFDRYHTVFTARGVLAKREDEAGEQPATDVPEQPQTT